MVPVRLKNAEIPDSPPSSPTDPLSRSDLLRALLFAGAYFASAELGHFLSFHPSNFATFWPASGLFLAALLRAEGKRWPLLLAASLVANLSSDIAVHGQPIPVSLGFWSGNALEALAGAALLRTLFGAEFTLRRWEHVFALIFLAGGLCTALGATVGTSVVRAAYGSPSFWQTWQSWWASDAIGIAVFAPLLLAPRLREMPSRVGPWPGLELLIFVFAIGTLGWALFTWPMAKGVEVLGLPYFIFPLVVWMGLACGPRGATIGVALTLFIAVWGTTQGTGPFARLSQDPSTLGLLLQGYVFTLVLVAVPLSVVADGARRLEGTLRDNIEELTNTRAAASADHALLHSLIDQRAGAVLAVDRLGRLILCNAAARELLDLSPSGAMPSEWARLIGLWAPDVTPPPSDSPTPLWSALRGTAVEGVEMPHPSPGPGRPTSLIIHAQPVYTGEGTISGAVLVAETVGRRSLFVEDVRQRL